MDSTNKKFIVCLSRLARVGDQNFCDAYLSMLAELEWNFFTEEQLMQDISFSEDDVRVHIEQHARLLLALHYIAAKVLRGDIDDGRRVIPHLFLWFRLHLKAYDSDLALAYERAGRSCEPRCRRQEYLH